MAEPLRMLPQAMSATSLTEEPVNALAMSRQRYKQLQEQLAQMDAQQPDMSAMQEFARRQGEMGQNALLNAIAAQYAGEAFQPLQAKFLRQAEASQQPLRIGSTMITPSGEIIRDPMAEMERRRSAVEQRLDRAAGDIRLIESARERAQAQREIAQERNMMIAQQGEENRQNRLLVAAMAAAARGGNAQAQPGPSPLAELPPPVGRLIPQDIELSPAMGLRGVVENTLGKGANLIGGGDPNVAGRVASTALDALATQTRATLTAAFPGRSSVELLRQLERHTIKPNELFTGVASVPQKARANIGMLQDALQRIQESTPVNATPMQRSQAMQSAMRIQSLINEYETLEAAARRQTTTATPQVAPRGQQQPAGGLSPAEQRELEALRARFGRQ